MEGIVHIDKHSRQAPKRHKRHRGAKNKYIDPAHSETADEDQGRYFDHGEGKNVEYG